MHGAFGRWRGTSVFATSRVSNAAGPRRSSDGQPSLLGFSPTARLVATIVQPDG